MIMGKKAIHIAIPLYQFKWIGALDLIRHMIKGLLAQGEKQPVKISLLIPDNSKLYYFGKKGICYFFRLRVWFFFMKLRSKISSSSNVGKLYCDYFENESLSVAIVKHNSNKFSLLNMLESTAADIVMPVLRPYLTKFPLPWLGYIADFQHKYLPENFSRFEILFRNIGFYLQLRFAKVVVVNSKAVKKDALSFYPKAKAKIVCLPYAPAADPKWLDSSDTNVFEKYNLPDKYFLISNQLWIHKSHLTAFKALAKLISNEQFSDYHIVCTGSINDYRAKNYYDLLNLELEKMHIADRVHFLGMIDKNDQIQIMKGSVALIQPTLFEGGPGGGSVYDAIAIGVPVILSDIEVNKEVEGNNVYFFITKNEQDLYQKMSKVILDIPQRGSNVMLEKQGKERIERLGVVLMKALRSLIENRNQ